MSLNFCNSYNLDIHRLTQLFELPVVIMITYYITIIFFNFLIIVLDYTQIIVQVIEIRRHAC